MSISRRKETYYQLDFSTFDLQTHGLHSLYRRAVKHPGKLFQDGVEGRTLEALYDAETQIMHTNVYDCPLQYQHHTGNDCPCCRRIL